MTMKIASEIAQGVAERCEGWSVYRCTIEAAYYWHNKAIAEVAFSGVAELRNDAGKKMTFDLGIDGAIVSHPVGEQVERDFVDLCVAQISYTLKGERQ